LKGLLDVVERNGSTRCPPQRQLQNDGDDDDDNDTDDDDVKQIPIIENNLSR
jgi:hypothetical protein